MNVQFSCPLCAGTLELPIGSVGSFQCPLCAETFSIEPSSSAPNAESPLCDGDLATQKQKNFLILHGVKFGEHITKKEASSIISKLIADNHEPSPEGIALVRQLERDQEQRERERTVHELKKAITTKLDKLTNPDMTVKELSELRSGLKRDCTAVNDFCQSRIEAGKSREEENRERLQHAMMTVESWDSLYRRPTHQQLQETLEDLDREFGWCFEHPEVKLTERLGMKFPHLRR
jgi:hypothetical protein